MRTDPRFREWMTPPQVGRQLRVKPERIVGWIRSGELAAVDVSSRPGVGRPRYRISPEALDEFLKRRAAGRQAKPAKRPKRRQPAAGVIQFY